MRLDRDFPAVWMNRDDCGRPRLPRKMKTPRALLLLFPLMNLSAAAQDLPAPIDAAATAETRALYHNLFRVGEKGILFGHQDDLAYGHEWIGEKDRSDVRAVTGDYPAVYGWDAGALEPSGPNKDIAGPRLNAETLGEFSRQAFARGGVVTFSWHAGNPVSGKGFYDVTPAAAAILPGGERHEAFLTRLDALADFFKSLAPMPVVFRPWHEHNGDWFWWGKAHTAEADYIALWRFTVHYLRDVKGVHNLLYAFSTDKSRIDLTHFERDYLYGWPGDDYVDVMGLDDYEDARPPREGDKAQTLEAKRADFAKALTELALLAKKRGKLPALTETGVEAIPVANWWTGHLLPALTANGETRSMAWVLVWRNANASLEKQEHYFAPFPGQLSAEDFVKFAKGGTILLEGDLPPMYREDGAK